LFAIDTRKGIPYILGTSKRLLARAREAFEIVFKRPETGLRICRSLRRLSIKAATLLDSQEMKSRFTG
jgi:hypothetical protein